MGSHLDTNLGSGKVGGAGRRALRLLAALAAVGAAASAPALAAGGASHHAAALPVARGGLDVLPFPGTPDAAPGTHIGFPSLAPGQIAAVIARGSRTGVHAGRLVAQAGGGSAFEPVHSFAPGERVSVTARLRSGAAGTPAGAPGSRSLRFAFTIARLAPPHAGASAATQSPAADGGLLMSPRAIARAAASKPPLTHSFVSEPQLHPPVVSIVGNDSDTAAGDIFLDAQNSSQNGPYILNSQGDLLWMDPTPKGQAALDVRVQRYDGQPVLTYYQGPIVLPGVGHGVDVLLNESYNVIHKITAGDGYQRDGVDLHEVTLTPQGNAFVTVYAPVRANLSSVGGPSNGVVLDPIIQEIHIADNHVLWEWSALGHIPLSDSYMHLPPAGQPYDAYHVNSIQPLPDGELIVSVRHTWAVYSINMHSGRINWELGGKHSSFRMGPGTNFEWQHHVRMHGHGLMTIFDDASDGLTTNERESRALELRLAPGRATLAHAYLHSPPVLAGSQGSVQLLFNGDVFVGWGAAPTFSEYTQSGEQLFKGWFRYPVQSYRAYRFNDWVGDPLAPPSIATKRLGTATVGVYASWNGATRVASWRVLAGPSRALMAPVAQFAWTSFESSARVSTMQAYVQVQALDAAGNVLGTSGIAASSGACVGSRC